MEPFENALRESLKDSIKVSEQLAAVQSVVDIHNALISNLSTALVKLVIEENFDCDLVAIDLFMKWENDISHKIHILNMQWTTGRPCDSICKQLHEKLYEMALNKDSRLVLALGSFIREVDNEKAE